MKQISLLDWPELPVAGRTPQARQASYAGACAAQRTFGLRQRAMLRFLAERQSATDEQMEVLMKRSSVCSTRNALMDLGLVSACGLGRSSQGRDLARYTLTEAGHAAVQAAAAER